MPSTKLTPQQLGELFENASLQLLPLLFAQWGFNSDEIDGENQSINEHNSRKIYIGVKEGLFR